VSGYRAIDGPYVGMEIDWWLGPVHAMTVNGQLMLARGELNIEQSVDGILIQTDPPQLCTENVCDKCGRADIREWPALSWADAIERGMVIPVERL
jgi:hypothetical protein